MPISNAGPEANNASIIPMYALHDTAHGAFAMPIFFQSEGLAIRALTAAVNGGDPTITAHPLEIQMFRIGSFNQQTGQIIPHGPELVITAAQLVAEKK